MKLRKRNHRAEIKPTPPPAPSRYTQNEIKEIIGKFIESGGRYRLKDDSDKPRTGFLF